MSQSAPRTRHAYVVFRAHKPETIFCYTQAVSHYSNINGPWARPPLQTIISTSTASHDATVLTFVDKEPHAIRTLFAPVPTFNVLPRVGLTLVVLNQSLSRPVEEGITLRAPCVSSLFLAFYDDIRPSYEAVLVPLFAATRFPLTSADVAKMGIATANY